MNETEPTPFDSAFVAAIRWGALFLLSVSVVMLPLLSGGSARPLQLLGLSLAGVAAFFWVLSMMSDCLIVVPWGRLTAAGALILAAALVSGIFSDCPQASLVTLLTWLGCAAVFLACVWVGKSECVRRHLVRLLCALALPIAVCGILQYVVLLDMTRAQIEADRAGTLRSLGLSEQDYDSLIQRTISKRVFATFVLPNSLAGYLLILLPPTIALAVSARRWRSRSVLASSAALMMLALFFTFSKAGWLAGGAVLLVFLATKGWRWLRRHGWGAAAALVAAAALLVTAASVSPTLKQRLTDMTRELGTTAHVRIQYWTAAIAMWRAHPILGVGPGNFQNQYLKYAPVAAEETRNAHNDYVQLLAECGPIAAAGYLLFWLFLLLGAVRSVRSAGTGNTPLESPPLPSPPPRWLFPAAAVLAIVAAAVLGRYYQMSASPAVNLGIFVLFAALWCAAYFASDEVAAARPALLTASLALGLLGFALHSLVDMDLYVDGLACTALAAAGLAAAPWLREKTLRKSTPLPVLLVISLVVVAMFYGIVRVACADSARSMAKDAARENSRDTLHLLEEAARLNPLDHESFAALGAFWERQFLNTHDVRDLERSLAAWKRATALNPSFADYHLHYARVFAAAAEQRWIPQDYMDDYQHKYDVLGLPAPPRGRGHFVPAIVEAHRATEDAPFKPQYRLFHGLLLRLAGLPGEAQKQYQIALDLHNTMVAQGAPSRQRLTDAELKTAEEGARLDQQR